MLDPYSPQPGHAWDCPCDDCQWCRERWASQQPSMIEQLDERNAEDE